MLHHRLQAGLVEETERLLAGGIPSQRLEAYGLEYRFTCRYLRGELNRETFVKELNRAIHKFAKRQETWFRRMARHGVAIQWLEADQDPVEEAMRTVAARLYFPGATR